MSFDAKIATPNVPADYVGNDRLPIGRVSADDWSVLLLEDVLQTITILSTYAIPITNGGTGATTAADARSNLGAAASGPVTTSGLTTDQGTILGRYSAGLGAIQAIAIGDGLLLAGGVLSTTDAGGTVTSVDLTVPTSVFNVTGGPITSSGTIDLTFKTQAANTVFAGPTTGGPATPTFRSLVATDLPSHTHTSSEISDATVTGLALLTSANVAAAQTTLSLVPGTNIQTWDADLDALAALTGTNTIYYRSAANTWTPVTISTGLSFSGGTLSCTVTGTVTSVDLSMPGIFSVSGNPVTTSGTLSVALVNQDANKVFAGPTTGSAASPTFRLLVAADIPSHTHVSTEISDSTTAGRVLLTAVDAAAQRTALSLRPGVDIQQWDADLDSLAAATGTNTIYYRSAANTWSPVTIGPGLNFVSGELSITEVGLGTVTSVDVSGGTTGLTFSGGPITTNGTITMAGTLAVANGGTGTTSVAGIKTLLDLSGTNTGDQTITLTGHVTGSGTGSFATTIASNVVANSMLRQSNGLSLIGRSTNSTGDVADITAAADFQVFRREGSTIGFGQIRLNSSVAVTGTLASANGGTGAASYADGDILYGTAAGGLQKLTGNTTLSKRFLSQTGTGSVAGVPSWSPLAATDMPAFTGGDVTSSVGSGTLTIGANKVTLSMLATMTGFSVIGQPASGSATPSAISTTTADHVLRMNSAGTSLAFGTIATGGIADNAVTTPKLAAIAALGVLCNPTLSTANVTLVQAGSDGNVLRRNGSVLDFGPVVLTNANGVTGALGLTNGGTGQTTAAAARGSSGLNLERGTGVGNTDYTILATDRFVYTNAAFTLNRTWTLPAANSVNAGHRVVVADLQGTWTTSNYLIVQRAGSDTINGGTTAGIATAYGSMEFISDGVSKWLITKYGPSTQAIMEANADITAVVTPGTIKYAPGVAKAWALIAVNGSNVASVTNGHNVSGVSRVSTGYYQLTLSTGLSATTNACVLCTCANVGGVGNLTPSTAMGATNRADVLFTLGSATLQDPTSAYFFVAVFGDM